MKHSEIFNTFTYIMKSINKEGFFDCYRIKPRDYWSIENETNVGWRVHEDQRWVLYHRSHWTKVLFATITENGVIYPAWSKGFYKQSELVKFECKDRKQVIDDILTFYKNFTIEHNEKNIPRYNKK